MNVIQTGMLYFSTIACALMLVFIGWTKVCNWLRTRAVRKSEKIESEIQARVKEKLDAIKVSTNEDKG